jgi:hypothetical protein
MNRIMISGSEVTIDEMAELRDCWFSGSTTNSLSGCFLKTKGMDIYHADVLSHVLMTLR